MAQNATSTPCMTVKMTLSWMLSFQKTLYLFDRVFPAYGPKTQSPIHFYSHWGVGGNPLPRNTITGALWRDYLHVHTSCTCTRYVLYITNDCYVRTHWFTGPNGTCQPTDDSDATILLKILVLLDIMPRGRISKKEKVWRVCEVLLYEDILSNNKGSSNTSFDGI